MLVSVSPVMQDRHIMPYSNAKSSFAGLTVFGQGNQGMSSSDLPGTETEQLLDIEGLLKILRIVRDIKKEGRLKKANDEHTKHTDIQHTSQLKDQ